jgi:hypothetical protein
MATETRFIFVRHVTPHCCAQQIPPLRATSSRYTAHYRFFVSGPYPAPPKPSRSTFEFSAARGARATWSYLPIPTTSNA